MVLGLAFAAWACGGGDGTGKGPAGPEEGFRPAPASTERTMSDPVVSIHILKLDAETGGGGDAVVVADSSGTKPFFLLLDGGDDGSAASFLRAAGVDTLDLMVLTHAHFDHFGGMDEVFDEVHVRAFAYNGQVRSRFDYEALIERAESEADTVLVIEERVDWREGRGSGMDVTIIPPFRQFLDRDTDSGTELNEGSLAVRIRLGSFTFLSTGDAEILANQRFVDRFRSLVDVDVLKVGHHGSADATQSFWLDAVSPDIALVSANGVTHPHGVVLDLLRRETDELFCTPQHGDLAFQVEASGAFAVRTGSDPRSRCRVGSEAY